MHAIAIQQSNTIVRMMFVAAVAVLFAVTISLPPSCEAKGWNAITAKFWEKYRKEQVPTLNLVIHHFDSCPSLFHSAYFGFKEACFSTGSGSRCDFYLGTKCPTSDGQKCVFPFTYKGKTYKGCTKQDRDALWCSTDPQFADSWTNCVGHNYQCPTD